jgi:GT2 family glycosyltransferase
VNYVAGACLLARRAAVDQVGLLDEGYFMYSEEVDWCRRMRDAAWQVWLQPAAKIIHHGGQSTRQQRQAMLTWLYRSKVRYFERHHGHATAAVLRACFVVLLQLRWLAWVLLEGRRGESARPRIHWRDLAPLDRTTLRKSAPVSSGGQHAGSSDVASPR